LHKNNQATYEEANKNKDNNKVLISQIFASLNNPEDI
jgi:hypothetical protein